MTRSKKQNQSFYLSLPLPVPTPSFPFPLRRRSGLQGGVRRSLWLNTLLRMLSASHGRGTEHTLLFNVHT